MKNISKMKRILVIIYLILGNYYISNSQIIVQSNTDAPKLFDLYELTFQLPQDIQQYVDSYLAGGPGINPYDYTQIDVHAIFVSPGRKIIPISGFYYEGQNKTDDGSPDSSETLVPSGLKTWNIRFTPIETGNWSYQLLIIDLVNNISFSASGKFDCNKSNNNNRNSKGFIRLANKRYLKYETGQPYYPVGTSQLSFAGDYWQQPEKGTNEFKYYIDEMATYGFTFFRFEINMVTGINLFGPDYSVGGDNLANTAPVYYDQFNQHDSWQLDRILDYANLAGIDLWVALQSFAAFGANGNYSDNLSSPCVDYGFQYTDPDNNQLSWIMTGYCGDDDYYSHCNWAKANPFNFYMESGHPKKSKNRGTCATPYDFFDINNIESTKVQHNLIKYIIARWGYATNILAFELMDEANVPSLNIKDKQPLFAYPHYESVPSNFNDNYVTWNNSTYDFIKMIDKNNHLITSAFAGSALPNSTGGNEGYYRINKKMDFTQAHQYMKYDTVATPNPENCYFAEAGLHLKAFNKPYIVGETGYWPDKTVDPMVYELHNMLWGTFFNGSIGPVIYFNHNFLSTRLVSNIDVLFNYKRLSEYSKQLPQFSELYTPAYIEAIRSTGELDFRTYYLQSPNGYELYGWSQDDYYRYLPMFAGNYLKKFPNTRPSTNNIINEFSLPVSKHNTEYEIKWFNTITGEYSVDNQRSDEYGLTLSMPTSLLESYYADAGFIISCKPSSGWVEKQTCPGQWNSVLANSELAIDDAGGMIYINTNRQICGFWKQQNNSEWLDAILNHPDDSRVLKGSTALLWSPKNYCIYYVGEDAKIYKLFWDWRISGWVCQPACPKQWNSVLPTSALTESPDGSIFYVNSKNDICLLYPKDGSMYDGMINTRVKPLNGKGLAYCNSNDWSTYYVGKDQKIWRVFYKYDGWQNNQVSPSQWNMVNTNSEIVADIYGNIFYVNTNNKLCILFPRDGSYLDGIVNEKINIKSGSHFTGNYGTIYFIGDDNNIYKEYYSSGWIYEVLNQIGFCQEQANSSILFSQTYGLYYVGLTDNMIHDFSYNHTLKTAQIDENNLNDTFKNRISAERSEMKYKVYPNPVSKKKGSLYIEMPGNTFNPQIDIYTIYGQKVKTIKSVTNGIDIHDLNTGMYILMIKNDTAIENYKIVVED